MIEFENVSFHYKNTDTSGKLMMTRGVNELSLKIGAGEFVVLAGDSGCGKTTVTRLINGLVPHYYEGDLSGRVRVGAMDVAAAGIGELAAFTGSVFQNPRSQFFNVDTTSELAFASENLCRDPDEIRESIRRTAREMKMEHLMDRSIFALSGGEKQKVACASVACAHPEIMVLDEPSSNLDDAGIGELKEVLSLWKREGRTVVIAEHRLYYLTDLADRLIILRDGRIAESFDSGAVRTMTEEYTLKLGLRALHRVPLNKTSGGTGSGRAKSGVTSSDDGCFLVCRDFDFHYKRSENGIRFSELRFRRGAVTAITGRNGAGKSTFARVLSGLENRAKGSVVFDGREWPVKKRPDLCYMIMQDVNHQLFTESVLEEVMLSIPGSVPEKEGGERARKVLRSLELLPLADVHPMALSGGQKQRVAIACGVVSEREILIFDEPTSGLDLSHMRQVAKLLRMLADDGKTVIVITHDTELVREAADEVAMFGESI